MQTRYVWVDIAKGIAIISIVFLHINYKIPFNSEMLPISDILGGSWRATVLFIIGGFFIKEERLCNPISFIKGKTKSLYLLILYFYIPILLMHNIFLEIGFYNTEYIYGGKIMTYWDVKQTVLHIIEAVLCAGREPILGAMWFVYVLFLALCGFSIISFILSRTIRDKKQYEWTRCIVLFILSLLSWILAEKLGINIPRFNNTITVMWLIYCGYKLRNDLNIQFDNKYVCILSLAILYQCIIISDGGIQLHSDCIRLTISSLAATYVLCYLSKAIEHNIIGHIFAKCGRDSFYIMALHLIGFKIGSLILELFGIKTDLAELSVTSSSFIMTMYYLIISISFSLIFMFLFRKVKNLFSKAVCKRATE